MAKLTKLLLVVCVIFLILFLGVGKVTERKVNASSDKSIRIYSVLPDDLTQALLNDYQLKTKSKLDYKLIDKNQAFSANGEQPDLYLASRENMIALALDNKLQRNPLLIQDHLPPSLYDVEGFWLGICYDPYVFLVNNVYSRKVGQKNMQSWEDLVNQNDIVVSMEDLSVSPEMRYFLTAFASAQGEEAAFGFLKNIHKKIPQYAKFAISPIRLTTIGEADLAITSRNKVIKYIENDFPAYIVEPLEGFPAQVFATGIGRNSKKADVCEKIISWLTKSNEAMIVTEKLGYGYLFLFPDEAGFEGARPDKLWLNEKYLSYDKQAALVDKWLQNVRFTDK